MKEQNEIIQETITELLKKMGFEIVIEIDSSEDSEQNGTVFNIITQDESNFLIGQYGANLQAIQHLARLLVRKKIDEKTKFIIDVNSYRKQKNVSIVEMAKEVAEQALNEKRVIIMKPMSNYERRLVHLELSKNDQVVTESIGEGESRKVVVKPANLM
ncbi:MAG: hypothetical protein ACD_11C00116G0014 [uncultured bacterium]|nr:MAG: hypothetical protein ACD_11C00116G0014 [uncultured bacterium]HBR71241.1 hypothetical protein [Candidatus Moranbacteria bacterium]